MSLFIGRLYLRDALAGRARHEIRRCWGGAVRWIGKWRRAAESRASSLSPSVRKMARGSIIKISLHSFFHLFSCSEQERVCGVVSWCDESQRRRFRDFLERRQKVEQKRETQRTASIVPAHLIVEQLTGRT